MATTASQKLAGAGALARGSGPHRPGVAVTYPGAAAATTVPAYCFHFVRISWRGFQISLGQLPGQPATLVRSGGGAAPPSLAKASRGDASFFIVSPLRTNCGQPG